MRFGIAGLLGLGLLISSVGPEVLAEELTGSEYLGWLAAGVLPCLWGLWLAPKVSYRRRDALVFLTMGPSAIPGALLFVKIIWRIAYLPQRDWPLRPDEVAAGRQTTYREPVEPSSTPSIEPPAPALAPVLPPWARDVTNG